MRIALLDLYTNGHHLKYASQLVSFLQDKGHEVMFITWEKDGAGLRPLTAAVQTPIPSVLF